MAEYTTRALDDSSSGVIESTRLDPPGEPIEITDDMLTGPTTHRETRENFEKEMSVAPVLMLALIFANVVIFAGQLMYGALDSQASIIAAGALHQESVRSGEIWRMLTAMFLHGSALHLIGNCLMLYVLGMAIEHAFGMVKAGALYLLAGLCGSAMSVMLSPGPSVGASGAIFGLAGGVIVFLLRYQKAFYLRDRRIATALMIWVVYTVGMGFLDPGIDNYAHIGGFIGGAVVGAILPARARLRQQAFEVRMKAPARTT